MIVANAVRREVARGKLESMFSSRNDLRVAYGCVSIRLAKNERLLLKHGDYPPVLAIGESHPVGTSSSRICGIMRDGSRK